VRLNGFSPVVHGSCAVETLNIVNRKNNRIIHPKFASRVNLEATMPNISQLTKLFHAIALNDQHRARDIANDIIAAEEKKGHSTAVQMLKGALNPNGHGLATETSPLNVLSESPRILTSALQLVTPKLKFTDIVLLPKWRTQLEICIKEWKNRIKLEAAGIARRRRLLFFGPPGCGKSVTAAALGAELGIPTYIVRFDSIIGAYLGQTAIHLRQLFRFAEETPCVLLIDEVDALGKKRGNPLDVGELDRIVIALMQELEHSVCQGLIVATSNLSKNLDDGLWRRFDLVAEFPRPAKRLLMSYAQSCASRWNLRLTAKTRKEIMAGTSFSEAERCIEEKIRDNILRES
jgi:AAA+ superfamily predicted ATPase